jgi:predicted nucleic acid-binding protein
LTAYVDTPVLVAALTRETPTARVQAWLELQPAGSLLLSEWVVTEFSAALSVKVRTGDIDSHSRSAALAKFHRLTFAALEIVPIAREHFRTAARFADHYDLGFRAGDALHLAVAVDRSATIITLDRRLAAAASGLGLSATLI